MSWTPERTEKARAMWRAGRPASQIAAELGGVTRNAVIAKMHRVGEGVRRKAHVNRGTKITKSEVQKRPRRAYRTGAHSVNPDASSKPVKFDVPVQVASRELSIMELTNTTCRWPTGGEGANTRFCGCRCPSDRPYCDYHQRFTIRRY